MVRSWSRSNGRLAIEACHAPVAVDDGTTNSDACLEARQEGLLIHTTKPYLQSTRRVVPATARAETNWSMIPHGTPMKLWSDHWHLRGRTVCVSDQLFLNARTREALLANLCWFTVLKRWLASSHSPPHDTLEKTRRILFSALSGRLAWIRPSPKV